MDSKAKIVDEVAEVGNHKDENSVKVLFKPAIVVFFFENGVVEVGVLRSRRGGGVPGKSLKVHGGDGENVFFEGLILFLIGKSFPGDLFGGFSRDWFMIIFRLKN